MFAPAAQAASVTPRVVLGNPDCEDLGYTTIKKFDPPNDGSRSGITIDNLDGHFLNWTSTVAVDAVIVKGGPNANVYEYPLDTFHDEGLSSPDNGGQPYGLSHVEFCTDNVNEPRNPAIDVEKVAVASPIPAGDIAAVHVRRHQHRQRRAARTTSSPTRAATAATPPRRAATPTPRSVSASCGRTRARSTRP